MKNVEKNQLKTAICMDYDSFCRLIDKLSDNKIKVEYDYEYGLSYYSSHVMNGAYISEDIIIRKLVDYFDVNITSIHTDDYSPLGVWIVYSLE